MKRNCLLSLFYKLKKKMFSRSSPVYGEFIMVSSTPCQMKAACEHLKYWPYVKAFYPVDDTHIKVIIYVSNHVKKFLWESYIIQSMKLMNQCVSQYGCVFIYYKMRRSIPLKYRSIQFLRPDEMSKPFSYFIDEMMNSIN